MCSICSSVHSSDDFCFCGGGGLRVGRRSDGWMGPKQRGQQNKSFWASLSVRWQETWPHVNAFQSAKCVIMQMSASNVCHLLETIFCLKCTVKSLCYFLLLSWSILPPIVMISERMEQIHSFRQSFAIVRKCPSCLTSLSRRIVKEWCRKGEEWRPFSDVMLEVVVSLF